MPRFYHIFFPFVTLALAGTLDRADAADLPIYKEPPVVAITPWTGFFVGGQAGYGWGTKTFLDNFPTPDLALDARPAIEGALGGLQAGYNYEFNWLVVGVEGDFSWSGVKNGSFPCFSFGTQQCSAHPEWFSTATGRAGVAFGPVLLYAKGGAAWVDDNYTDIATCGPSQPTRKAGITAACGDLFTANDARVGWTAGLGIEYRFAPNWSAWAEYDYMGFGGRSVSFTDGGTGYFTEEIHQIVNVVKVGVNYTFDGIAPPAALNMLDDASTNADTQSDTTNRVIPFTGLDVSKLSFDAYAGTVIAPYKDLDTSGIRLYLIGDGGWYKYYDRQTGEGITGISLSGDFLAGYAFEGDNYSLNVFAGPSAENDVLSAVDPTNKVVGTEFGAKFRTDDFYNPTARTLIHAEGEFSSAFVTYYTSDKFGYDFFNDAIFIGPEVGTLGNQRFKQLRIGGNVTQIKIKNVQIDLSGGYANDSVVGPGAYGRIEINTVF